MYRVFVAVLFCACLSAVGSVAANPLSDEIFHLKKQDWTEWYAGIQAGVGFANHEVTELEPDAGPFIGFNGVGTSVDHDSVGVVGGVHIGARLGIDSFVVGAIADFDVTSVSGQLGPQPINASLDNNTLEFNARWMASVRGTVGIAHEDLLFYGTAGLAWMNADIGLSSSFPIDATSNETLNGLTFGGGIEWRMDEKWSLGVEYRHTRFENVLTHGSINFMGGQTFNFENQASMDTVYFKLSLRM